MRATTNLQKANAYFSYRCTVCNTVRPGHYFVIDTKATMYHRRKQLMDPAHPCAVCRGVARK